MPRPASAATAAPRSPTRLALYAAAGLLGVDLLAAWLLLPAERPSTATAVVLACASPRVLIPHMLGCAGLGLLLQRHYHALIQAPGAAFGFVLASLLGPVGAATATVALLLGEFAPRAWALSASDLTEASAEDAALLREASLAPDALLEPRSLADVFRFGSLSERRSAVALIGANYKPAFAEALRMALHDEHNAIRVQAGMVMQTLEDSFDRRRQALEARLDGVLRSHGFGGEEVHKELARLYDHQAYSGLLDDDRSAEARDKALAAYQAYLATAERDAEATAAVGRLLVRAGRNDAAVTHLRGAIEGGERSVSVLMWLAEALYRQRRYSDLRTLVQQHGERLDRGLPADSPLRATLHLWREQADRDTPQPDAGAADGR